MSKTSEQADEYRQPQTMETGINKLVGAFPDLTATEPEAATHADADVLIRTMLALMVAERSEMDMVDIPPTKRAWFDKAYTYSNARGDKSFGPTPQAKGKEPPVEDDILSLMHDLYGVKENLLQSIADVECALNQLREFGISRGSTREVNP